MKQAYILTLAIHEASRRLGEAMDEVYDLMEEAEIQRDIFYKVYEVMKEAEIQRDIINKELTILEKMLEEEITKI